MYVRLPTGAQDGAWRGSRPVSPPQSDGGTPQWHRRRFSTSANVGDLFRLRGFLARPVGEHASPVAANDLDARMRHESVPESFGRGLL